MAFRAIPLLGTFVPSGKTTGGERETMRTVTEITAATHPDVFARITRLDTPPARMWAVG